MRCQLRAGAGPLLGAEDPQAARFPVPAAGKGVLLEVGRQARPGLTGPSSSQLSGAGPRQCPRPWGAEATGEGHPEMNALVPLGGSPSFQQNPTLRIWGFAYLSVRPSVLVGNELQA